MTTTEPEDPSQTLPAAVSDPDGLPLAMTHAAMNAAYDNGEALPLSTDAAWLVRHCEAWWVVYERGWLRVTDDAAARDLDEAAARLAHAEAIAAPQHTRRHEKQ